MASGLALLGSSACPGGAEEGALSRLLCEPQCRKSSVRWESEGALESVQMARGQESQASILQGLGSEIFPYCSRALITYFPG